MRTTCDMALATTIKVAIDSRIKFIRHVRIVRAGIGAL
jgi:hypothetical protein